MKIQTWQCEKNKETFQPLAVFLQLENFEKPAWSTAIDFKLFSAPSIPK